MIYITGEKQELSPNVLLHQRPENFHSTAVKKQMERILQCTFIPLVYKFIGDARSTIVETRKFSPKGSTQFEVISVLSLGNEKIDFYRFPSLGI